MKPAYWLCLVLFSGVVDDCCRSAIVYPKAPDGGRQIVSEGLKSLSRSISRYLEGHQAEDLTIADPLRDYSFGLTNLVSGQFLSAAKPGAWRYLLMHGTNAVAAAELVVGGQNGNPLKFAGLDTSDFSRKTLEGLQRAERLPQVNRQDYEVRRLDCPSILFVALWLHGKSGDIIIPLPPTFGRWKPYQAYSQSQMMNLLKPTAIKKLKEPEGKLD